MSAPGAAGEGDERPKAAAPSAGGRVGAALALAAALAVAAAVWAQDHSGWLPLGLFNAARETYAWLSATVLAAALAAAALFAFELARGRATALGGALRGLAVGLVLAELGLATVDVLLVSRDPHGRIGGPYWETRNARGEWVFLKRAHPGSPLGFRTREPHALEPPAPRVLFLGDSYTEGSGRAPACNYPDVAEETLASALGREIQVMNAGVAGYGPRDALHLLHLLVERGYRFDALVFHLFLENDFTDDLPRTERRVVAGMPLRFPDSGLLRALHPLDWRLFRYGAVAARLGELVRDGAKELVAVGDGACEPGGEPFAAPTPALRALVERRLRANYGPEPRLALEGVRESVEAMAALARERGVPFVLVVFPDRIRADAALRAHLLDPGGGGRLALDRLAEWVALHLDAFPRVDATPVLAAGEGLYRAGDTHLSDRGNLVAGRFVGERLAALLGPEGLADGRGRLGGPAARPPGYAAAP